MLKTFDELSDEESLCKYCSATDYGEHKSCITPNGYYWCEGAHCEDAYRELEEMNFDAAKDNAINQIKSEIKSKIELTYSDERELKDEIKNEIKERVYDSIIKEVGDKYADKFNDYVENQLSKNPERLSSLQNIIKCEVSENLYENLYSSIRNEVIGQVKDATTQLCNLIGNNSVKVKDSNKTISKEEYEDLLDRDRKLSALEAGGVDNWEWYGESLAQYYNEE